MTSQSEEQQRQEYNEQPKLCKWCGNEVPFERRLGSFCCENCAREHANKRHRDQYWAEKPKIQARHAKYYQDHKEERRAHQKEYDAANPNRHKEYYDSHREQILQQKKEQYAADPEKMRKRIREQYHKHKYEDCICEACGKQYTKIKTSLSICPDCVKRRHDALYGTRSVYRLNKNGSIHRQVLRDAGILTPDMEEEGMAVHHMDGNRSNNIVDNLFAMSPGTHSRLHKLIEKEWITHQDMTMEQLSEYVMMKYNLRYY